MSLLVALGLSVLLLVVVALYFLPLAIALRWHHPNAAAIAVINFLFGWTLIGWVAALVWALYQTPDRPRAA